MPVTDAASRSIERSHQGGDPEATELLVRAYERAGDPHARCKVLGHDIREQGPRDDVSIPPAGRIFGTQIWDEHRVCWRCAAVLAVYGVRRSPFSAARGTIRYWLHRSLGGYLPSSDAHGSSGALLEAARTYMTIPDPE